MTIQTSGGKYRENDSIFYHIVYLYRILSDLQSAHTGF